MRSMRSLAPLAVSLLALGPACHCGSSAIRAQAPVLDVQPNPIVITPVPLQHTATIQVKVTNAGNTDLHFTKDPELAETDGDSQTELSVTSSLYKDCQGLSRATGSRLILAPGECALVTLNYAPANLDADAGTVTFFSDDPEHGTLVVPITLGPPATLKLCTLKSDGTEDQCDAPNGTPPVLDFGVVARGASAKKKLRMSNPGQVRIDFASISAPLGTNRGDFVFDPSPALPSYLDPGKSFDLGVTFLPGASGQRGANFIIDSNDSVRDPIKVTIQGRGDGAALCADPFPVEFGNAGVGQKVDKTLTLINCGTVNVKLAQTGFDPFSAPSFSNTTPLPSPQTLIPGQKLTIGLRWVPDETGDATASLEIPNDGNPSQTVDLHGTGVATCISASVRTLDFGQVARGQSADRQLTVANNSALACQLSKVAITAGSSYFSVVSGNPSSPVTLKPGDAYPVTLRYSVPQNDTNPVDNGTVTFTSNDLTNPSLDVGLVGHQVASPSCKLQISPASGGIPPFGGRTLVFGNVLVGKEKVLAVTMKNVGSGACNVSGYKFVSQFGIPIPGGPGANCGARDCDDFHLVAPFPSGTLNPGDSTAVTIKFTPTGTTQLPLGPTDFLQVSTNDQNIAAGSECIWGLPPNGNAGCIQVGMSGQGDISNLQVLPSDLDFGLTTLGCKTQEEYITLYNTGTTAKINIKSITLNPTTAPFYVVAPPTPFAMNPGARVQIKVTYRPTGAQHETAQLLIENDASNASSNNPYTTVGLSGTGTTDKHQTDTFTQSTLPKVDLLFVIDNSGSFAQYQDQISKQAKAFICAAKKDPNACTTSDWKADFHIGVIGNQPDQTDDGNSDASYREKIYVGGLYGHPSIIDNNTPNAIDAFAKNVKIGTCCSDSRESDAESAWRSLTPKTNQTAAPVGSLGFLRDDARLVMLAVTDEVDQSHNNTAFYVDFFQQLKGKYNSGLVSFNAITGDKGNGCNANGISAAANDFDIDIISQTGGKFWSLCSADWAKIATDLTLDAFNGRKQFSLSRVADPATVVVKLNGTVVKTPADYTFDQASNSVVFNLAPLPGAVIVVDYDAICF